MFGFFRGKKSDSALFCALMLGLLCAVGDASEPLKPINQYVHNVWQTEEGLPQNSVQTILQTNDGYLWMGTEEGLARFDGVQFTLFNKANTGAILHNDVRALMQDQEGNLWVGTFGGGVLRYRDGSFQSYSKQEGLSNNFVNALLRDSKGNIWIGTNDGLNQFRNGQFTRMGRNNGLSDDAVNALAEDLEGNLWVGTNHGANRVSQGIFDSSHIKIEPVRDVVRALYVDKSGVVWIGADQLGLYAFDSNGLMRFGAAQRLPKAPVLSLLQDEHGSLWVGTGGGGICRLDNFHPGAQLACYSSGEGMSGDTVMALFEDREKSVWAGTETGGLNRFKDGSLITYGSADGFDGAVRSIYEGRDGALWVALNTGLRRIKDGRVTRYQTPNGPANNYAWAVMEDRSENVWVGTDEGGLNVFTHHGLQTYTTRDGLADNQVHAVFQDAAGDIWIGTERGGVSLFSGGKFKNFTTKDGLSNNRVWTIFEDHDHNLWFGTDGGLSRFDHGRFVNLDLQNSENDGQANGGVIYIYEDRDHVLWIGTYGNGLKRLENGKLTTYNTRNGLLSDNVWAILEDDYGSFWMSSNLGIFQVKKTDLTSVAQGKMARISSISYGASDGMLGECNGGSQNAAWKTRRGALLFSCVRGIVEVSPGSLKFNSMPPPVVIEKALINGHDLLPAKNTNVVGRGDLEFHFSGLSFVAPEKVTFRYKLEGFSSQWTEAGGRRAAYYTNIPAGHYTFRVVASNNDGVWNTRGASFSFYIQPHFYQTIPFYCAAVLAVVFLCAGGYWMRVGQLQRRGLELTRLVAERTRDLEQQVEERVRVQEELKATAAIVESSHDAIWSDRDGVILTWNHGAEKLFGYSAEEAIGKNVSMLMPEGREAKVKHNRQTLEEGRRIPTFETIMLAKGGTPRYVSLTLSPMYRQGKVVAFSAIAHDIQARKQAEEALKNAKHAAEAATRAKSEFLANMSHEIRTPLNGVLGMINLVNSATVTPEQKELLDMAHSSADALLVIIDDILDFSKIEAGKLQFIAEPFDIGEAVAEAARTVAVKACQKDLELVSSVAPNAPQKLIGDSHRLKQVLINLLGNAVKFTQQGEVVLRVQMERMEAERAILKFSVSDTGIGISEAQQQLIFAPFEQADASTTRRFGGTGLGLAISSRIVAIMGGVLGVSSELGKGSTFHFKLSLPVAEPMPVKDDVLLGISALVVDDNQASRNILKERLEDWGMMVKTADSGASGLEELQRAADAGADFGVMLLDYHMPEMDGGAMAERMSSRADICVPTVMMFTSADYQAVAQGCSGLGVGAHLVKPIRPLELRRALIKLLNLHLPGLNGSTNAPFPDYILQTQNLSVLLVEDNIVNQRLAYRLLEKAGHSVFMAGNGREALEQYEQQQFDLILMDIQMPEMDGFAATKAIRQREGQTGLHCPIIAMTAHAMLGDKEMCLQSGMDGYISKPIDVQTLLQTIDSVLREVTLAHGSAYHA